ncbi:MFS transporter [Millionella massiliensis]|uniref:MFS transporter n=1 Tax=Millionella massiliensis TaxID=1871023 RepID=UPI0008D9DCB7|nr:MFS transporter [Millionella massiliensis]
MTQTQQKKNYVLPIAMMFALFAMISFVTGLTNPIGVIVKNQFAVANWMSQLGNAANFIAYAFMGIPAGLLLQKIGYKKTALLAIAVGFVGVGIQFLSGEARSFGVYLCGAFISGFSMCMLNTVVNPMLNTLGGGGKKGNQLIQFGGTLNSISATIVPILVGYLMGNAANATISDAAPALFIAMGIFALAFIVLASMQLPEPNREVEKKEKGVKDKHSALSFRHFVLGTVAIFLYVGVEVGIPNFVNLFLTNAPTAETPGMGLDATLAGSVVGTYWFLMMCGRLIGGVLGGKFSAKAQITFVCLLALIFLLVGMYTPSTITVSMPVFTGTGFAMAAVPMGVMFFVLCGLCTSVMWGGIFNLAVEGLGKYTAMGSGLFMVMVCGGGILPLIQGGVADLTGNYMASYWVIFAAVAYILYYALLGCKNVNKDIKVD